ncbi:MAG: serine/threonine protein kinase [Anaerolineales bacterium]
MGQPGWIGRSVGGRYQIESLLGQGGMSAVYKATDPNLRRQVAIKMIHPHLSQDPQFVSRFEEEAAAVARLKHPNIIQVYDFDHDHDTYYMVLEYVSGETLAERMRRFTEAGEGMPAEDAVKIAASVCDALDYAHERDMIHRDIKPANIMINEQGQPILMDFGVAKIVGGKQHTATGAVVGTALYISPEQVRGLEADRRADIYSLGVTLFEMLSGRPPFEGDSAMSTMMMHVSDPVPDIRELNPQAPPDLISVVKKSLKKDRRERYSTAAQMASSLRRADLSPSSPGRQVVEEPADGPATVPPPGRELQGQRQQPSPPPAAAPPPSSTPPPASAEKSSSRNGRRRILAGGAVIGALVACLALAGLGFVLINQAGGFPAAAASTETPVPTATVSTPPTEPPTEAPPTYTPEPAMEPTPTEPRGPFVRINGISVESELYIVDYETFGYIENLPGQHVHFFFDTVPPEQAGVPGDGPWFVWGGPRPFDGYHLTDRPAGATQLCTLSANPDHSVVPDSGNCVDLPEG